MPEMYTPTTRVPGENMLQVSCVSILEFLRSSTPPICHTFAGRALVTVSTLPPEPTRNIQLLADSSLRHVAPLVGMRPPTGLSGISWSKNTIPTTDASLTPSNIPNTKLCLISSL